MPSATRRLAPLLAAVVVLAPLLRAPEADSYPLSTYPMFSTDRGREATIATAVGIGGDGSVRRLSPEAISGTDEVILAAATVSAAVRRGEVEELCEEIASRLSGSDHREVVIRSELIDIVEHVAHDAPAISITEHGRCEVTR